LAAAGDEMIAIIVGKIVEREESALIVDVNGVGYRVAVMTRLREKFKRGSEVTLKIHHHITGESQSLFGFNNEEDLKFFELLLKVPSVGPATALRILEVAPPKILEQAVAEDDVAVLTKVSGVGKKTAERLLIELKGKIVVSDVSGVKGGIQHEAIEALTSIGFTAEQARSAVQKLPAEVKTVEEAVKSILQRQEA